METRTQTQPIGTAELMRHAPVSLPQPPIDQGWVGYIHWLDQQMEHPGEPVLSAQTLGDLRHQLLTSAFPATSEDIPATLRMLQELESAITATKAELLTGSIDSREAALALRCSPNAIKRIINAGEVLRDVLPHTQAALREGRLTEQRAQIIITETACLKTSLRQRADELLCADPATVEGLGIKRLTALVRGVVIRLDQAAVVERNRAAAASRHVCLRPLPDGMSRLSATLPMKTGISVLAELTREAASRIGVDAETRGKGELMADLLVERVVGHPNANNVPLHLNVIMSDTALLGAGSEPATILDGNGVGHGVIPASVARNMIFDGFDAGKAVIRKLYANPAGDLIAMTSRQRFFTGGLADYLYARDQGICRTPYCDAPIRHLDHVIPASQGGETSATNGQGLCVTCNEAKDRPGWKHEVVPGKRHTVRTTTPTEYQYRSTAPPPR
ncbi:MAG: DUF222 domain-containing protein [Promicromonosporaceae bacterium]|nr:DUF222 domain-containing protein [Promicromonosporaceae bacterium]